MNNKELLEKIQYIDNKYSTCIFEHYNNISKRKDLIKSLTSEIKCLLILEQFFDITNVTHDSDRETKNDKTPDWTLSLDGVKIIIEVYNQNINEFTRRALAKSKLGEFKTLEIRDDRLSKGGVREKYSKYVQLIKESNIPYFIFIESDFLADTDKIDLSKFLYGPQVEDITGVIPSFYTRFQEGFYYSNRYVRKFINGFFLLKEGRTSYFHNYNSKNQLPDELKSVLLKLQVVHD